MPGAHQNEVPTALDAHRDVFAALDTWERHTDLIVVPDAAELSELAVGGYVREAADQLAAAAEGQGPDAETARDALKLLYRYVGAGVAR